MLARWHLNIDASSFACYLIKGIPKNSLREKKDYELLLICAYLYLCFDWKFRFEIARERCFNDLFAVPYTPWRETGLFL